MEVEVQGGEVVAPEGAVTDEGVQPEGDVILASDQPEFTMPEKFAGKSAEDIARSYMELEKFKGGDQESKGGEEPPKETKETETPEEAQYQKYAQSLDKNGALSEAEYAELAEAGYDKPTVDKEITRRADQKEFEAYKAEKTLNDVLEPLGGGTEKFKAVAEWANGAKDAAEVKAFNDALAIAPKVAQQAMLKGLYAEYEAGNTEETILHTNTPQSRPSTKYNTQEEFFKDVGSDEYQNNPKYRQAVEKKMSLSDIF